MYVRERGEHNLPLRNDVVVLGFVCDYQRETLGFLFYRYLESSCVIFSRRSRRLRRGNAAGCIISQRKTGRLRLRLFCGFVCVNQRDLREKWPFTHKERTSEEQAIKQQGLYISTVWNLSLSARSTASALADPFDQPVFRLRNLRNLRENRPFTHKGRTSEEQVIK
jgi:hypothetical protein